MGCCLEKLDSDESEAKHNGKPEITLLVSTEDDKGENQSNQISPDGDRFSALIALYDYASRNAQDLNFKKWDQFFLKSKDSSDWWLVKRAETDEEGYVPRNFVAVASTLQGERWFFGTITRKDTERLLLKAGKKGCFLIRESETSQNSYSLSILNEDTEKGVYVKHYRIRCNGNGAFYITEDLEFSSLPSLVIYYHDDSHGLCCQLVEPCPIRDTPQTYSLAPKVFNIEENRIKNLEEIENDDSGILHKAQWNDALTVAVKRYSSETNPSAPESLKRLHHKSIVKFFGTISPQPLSLCWEYLSERNLAVYLKNPNNASLTLIDLVEIAMQVAIGMAYLEASNVAHKCLRARHVMVGEGPVFKVSDYSLYGSPLKTDQDTALWMSPEAIQNGIHDLKSDVWSFGVLIMEIVTKCEMPAWGPGESQSEFPKKLLSGHRMPRHDDCPEALYELLVQCWDKERELRPTFEYIQIFLESFFQRTDVVDQTKVNGSGPKG